MSKHTPLAERRERRALSVQFWQSQAEVRRRVERRQGSPWRDRTSPPPPIWIDSARDPSLLTRLRQEPEWVLLGAATLVGVFLGLGLAALLSVFGGLR